MFQLLFVSCVFQSWNQSSCSSLYMFNSFNVFFFSDRDTTLGWHILVVDVLNSYIMLLLWFVSCIQMFWLLFLKLSWHCWSSQVFFHFGLIKINSIQLIRYMCSDSAYPSACAMHKLIFSFALASHGIEEVLYSSIISAGRSRLLYRFFWFCCIRT